MNRRRMLMNSLLGSIGLAARPLDVGAQQTQGGPNPQRVADVERAFAATMAKRDAAGFVGKHRGHFGVDPVLADAHEHGDRPQQGRSPTAQGSDRVSQGSDQKTGIRQGYDETVVPTDSLEQLRFCNRRVSHNLPLR